MIRVFLVAGELSGDRLGSALMEGLTELTDGQAAFEGVGGPRMEAQGLQSLFPMSEINVMGVSEILMQYRHLKRRIRETAEAVIAAKPDVLVTVDLPEFGLRVARMVKAASDIRCVHYVAPTVWAWRPGRAAKMARYIDHVLALYPFEPPLMEAAGMRCDFVGHPVVTEPVASDAAVRAFRERHGLGEAETLLMLPGSRRSEVGRLLPVFAEVAARLAEARPGLRIVVPAAASVVDEVRTALEAWPGAPVVVDPAGEEALDQKRAAFRAADAALAASGTVSLELAAAGTPMVIAYDMSWLSRQVIGRRLITDTVTLVNLVSETREVPEFLGRDCRPGPVAEAVGRVLDAPERQDAAMRLTMERLGLHGDPPGRRAAQAVLDGIAAAGPAR